MPQGHFPHPDCTAWHITIGAARSRLHGGPRRTVDRHQNQPGDPIVEFDEWREFLSHLSLTGEPVRLNDDHRKFIEAQLPLICERGRWTYHICAAPPPPENDHFHILLDAPRAIHGKDIRHWLKRWLTETLNEQFDGPPDDREAEGSASRATLSMAGTGLDARSRSPRPWWVKGGSTKPVKQPEYFLNAFGYIRDQRTTPFIFDSD